MQFLHHVEASAGVDVHNDGITRSGVLKLLFFYPTKCQDTRKSEVSQRLN